MTHQAEPSPVLTVIVPAFRCEQFLRRCLDALLASTLDRAEWELIVVDDSSGDETPTVAKSVADRVLVTPAGPRGPGFARNLGASHAKGDILVFVDSDVLVTPTTLAQFVAAFAAHPTVAAVHGSYDTEPGDRGFVSQYRNLLHHWVHTINPGTSDTFWAGCGAVRRVDFQKVGGFDADRFPRPQIEDIEFGYRLRDHGLQIRLDPLIQGKHLKRWTFGGVMRTDLFDRAIPWTHLLIDRKSVISDGPLNLRAGEKFYAANVGVAFLALVVGVGVGDIRWLWLCGLCSAVVVLGNRSLISWFARIRGIGFAVACIPMRFMYYGVCLAGSGWAIVTHFRLPEFEPPQRVKNIYDIAAHRDSNSRVRS